MWKSESVAYGLMRLVLWPFTAGFDSDEHFVPGRQLVVAPHRSFMDGPLLAISFAQQTCRVLHIVAYSEPFQHPIWGWILRSGGSIPFVRGNSESQYNMLASAYQVLMADGAVGIFPQGHVMPKGEFGRARPGAALLALAARAPITPVVLLGVEDVLPRQSVLPRLGQRVRIRVGKQITFPQEIELYHNTSDQQIRMQLVAAVTDKIMAALTQLA